MRRDKKNSYSFIDSLKEYINLKIEYYELTVVEKISLLVGRIVLLFLFIVLALAVLLMLMVLIYTLLMMWIGIPWLVTLIEIGILFLFIGLLWWLKDKLIITPVANSIIKVLLDKNDEEEEDDE